LHDLQTFGYTGDSLAGVDPDSNGFHDFRGQEIELKCEHEKNEKGEAFERWSPSVAKPNLKDKSKLRRFDRILTKSHADGAAEDSGQGISDADVPF
jgi:hypothetical protein